MMYVEIQKKIYILNYTLQNTKIYRVQKNICRSTVKKLHNNSLYSKRPIYGREWTRPYQQVTQTLFSFLH